MGKKVELYRKCHKDLGELYDKRQIALFNVDNEIRNKFVQDGAIRQNGMFCAITPQGDNLFLNKHYLELAEDAENKEREKELRERNSFVNQRLVEETIKQSKNDRKMLYISGIVALGTILGIVFRCS